MAISGLIEARVKCNEALAAHPRVQVSGSTENADCYVGILGVINGLMTDGNFVAACYENDCLTGFTLMQISEASS